jgi:hypothetical protein
MSLDGRVESRDTDGDPYGAVLGGEIDLLGTDGKWATVQVQRCGKEKNGRGLGSRRVSHNMSSYSGDSEGGR